jgi:hypothetical protein
MTKEKILLIICLLIFLAIPSIIYAQETKNIIETESGEKEKRVERIAIIIGINGYLNISPLKYAVKDAQLIGNALSKKGVFDVTEITDESSIKPTKHNIMDTLDEMLELSKLDMLKTFVFFFSGHGFQNNGKNYLAPIETDPGDLTRTGIDLDDVLSKIKEVQKKSKVMVFIDACRTENSGKGNFTGWTDYDSRGLAISYSTTIGDFSYESNKKKNGIYSLYLNEALEGKADLKPFGNGDKFVSFAEAVKYVTYKLRKWSKDNPGKKQTPSTTTIEKVGDFYLTSVDKVIEEPQDEYDDDPDGLVTYEIIVVTGDVWFAGTDANIYLTINGEDGSIKEFLLVDDDAEDDFEIGYTDYIEIQAKDVGGITSIRVRHDNRGQWPDWYLDGIIITNKNTGQQWIFSTYKWFSKTDGDGKIDRTLTPDEKGD